MVTQGLAQVTPLGPVISFDNTEPTIYLDQEALMCSGSGMGESPPVESQGQAGGEN